MAKKAPSTLVNMFLSLTVVAFAAAAVLAFMSNVTEEPIKKAEQDKTEQALREVLPPFDHVGQTTIDGLPCTMAYDADNALVGVAVEAVSKKGFGGNLGVMYGFNPDGSICGYKVLKSSETPGLGAKAQDWFQQGQKGDIIGKQAGNLTVSILLRTGFTRQDFLTEVEPLRQNYNAVCSAAAGEKVEWELEVRSHFFKMLQFFTSEDESLTDQAKNLMIPTILMSIS